MILALAILASWILALSLIASLCLAARIGDDGSRLPTLPGSSPSSEDTGAETRTGIRYAAPVTGQSQTALLGTHAAAPDGQRRSILDDDAFGPSGRPAPTDVSERVWDLSAHA
jgi:hypothetical protein